MYRFGITTVRALVVGSLIASGCATPLCMASEEGGNTTSSPATTTAASGTPVSIPALSYIVPTNDAYIAQNGVVNGLRFGTYDKGSRADHEMLSVKRAESTLIVELKRANAYDIGSGIVYTVGVATSTIEGGYRIELKPISFTTYKQGLFPFALPTFTEADLEAFLLTPTLHYRIEIDSEFNSESTFANLKRLLKSRPFAKGERDPITNKIYTQQFVLPYRGKEVLLTAEAFPYRNGSKVVINLRLPAAYTSPNTVDYRVILDEVTQKLREVIAA